MDTLNQILPFYDTLEKQDKSRYKSNEVRYCSQSKLLPFIIKRAHTANYDFLTTLNLVDSCGVETDLLEYFKGSNLLTGWTNDGYNRFTSSGADIDDAMESGTDGKCYSNTISLVTGYSVVVTLTVTVTPGGQIPKIMLTNTGTIVSRQAQLVNGLQTVRLTATAQSSRIEIRSSSGCEFTCHAMTAYKYYWPLLYFFTSIDYFQFNASSSYFCRPLPFGKHYIKASDGNSTWYSEWFEIIETNINLVEGWINTAYETFTASAGDITAATNTSGDGRCHSNPFVIRTGEVLTVEFTATLLTGDLPLVYLVKDVDLTSISSTVSVIAGLNTTTLTSTIDGYGCLAFLNSASNGSFIISGLRVIRSYTNASTGKYFNNFSKITFTNTLDLGDILYQKSFTQAVYLSSQLLKLDPKQIITGEERNGVMIQESIITMPIYKLIDFVSPSLLQALKLISGHNTITITDEFGNTYSPDNIEIISESVGYECYKVDITFTENEIVNTLNQINIV